MGEFVAENSQDGQTDTDWFDPGSVLLDYKGGQVMDGTASFIIAFSEIGGGGEEPTEPEKGDLCADDRDNDGDGLINCDDPNCKKWCR